MLDLSHYGFQVVARAPGLELKNMLCSEASSKKLIRVLLPEYEWKVESPFVLANYSTNNPWLDASFSSTSNNIEFDLEIRLTSRSDIGQESLFHVGNSIGLELFFNCFDNDIEFFEELGPIEIDKQVDDVADAVKTLANKRSKNLAKIKMDEWLRHAAEHNPYH